ncbi:hypothetical protein C8Q78DRAFT_1044939 [Trametes maxima]|nr:hypothetical protein C8Q78DRAFT_1044939 [Trametes maxima]
MRPIQPRARGELLLKRDTIWKNTGKRTTPPLGGRKDWYHRLKNERCYAGCGRATCCLQGNDESITKQ